jgi:perosamine synthetase
MPAAANVDPTYWLYTVLLPETATLTDRKEVIRKLNARDIDARPFWHPLHGLPPYRQCQKYKIEHSNRLYERGVSLPSSVGLEEGDLARCIAAFRDVFTG